MRQNYGAVPWPASCGGRKKDCTPAQMHGGRTVMKVLFSVLFLERVLPAQVELVEGTGRNTTQALGGKLCNPFAKRKGFGPGGPLETVERFNTLDSRRVFLF